MPELHGDGRALGLPYHARALRGAAGQVAEAIERRAFRSLQENPPEALQLPIQGQPGHVGATHGNGESRIPIRPEARRGAGPLGRQGQEGRIFPLGPSQGNPKGQPRLRVPRGHGQAAVAQQVHKVRPGAQAGIQAHGVRGRLLLGVKAGDGGEQHGFRIRDGAGQGTPKGFELGEGGEGLRRLKGRGGFNDGAGHGKERLRCAFKNRRHDGIALGHPGPLVKEPPGRKQGLSVKGHKLKARCLRLGQRLIPKGQAVGAIQGHLVPQGHGEAPPPGARHGAKAQGPRLLGGIGRIIGTRHLRHCAQGL